MLTLIAAAWLVALVGTGTVFVVVVLVQGALGLLRSMRRPAVRSREVPAQAASVRDVAHAA